MFDRSIRWSLLLFASVFAFGFGGVGVGALIAAVFVFVPKSTQKKLSSAQGTGVGVIWVFAFFWNIISIPVAAIALPQLWAEGNWIGFLVLLFPLIGLFLLWAALKSSWDYLRRGGAKVVFAKDELVVGEPVQGHFEFGRKVKVGENFRVRLEAMTYPGQSGERTLWSKEVPARVTDSGGGPRLSFRIDTPEKVRSQDGADVFWRLDAIAANPAADVHYKFPVTIEQPEEEEEEEMEEEVMALSPAFSLEARGGQVERLFSGMGVNMPPEAAAKFKQMTPEEREKIAKLLALAPKAKKWVIWGVVGFVVLQVVLGIIGMISS